MLHTLLDFVYNGGYQDVLTCLNFTASSYDFEESIKTVGFSPRQSTATVYITIKDDSRVETTEAFQVEILVPYWYLKGLQLGNPSRATVFIKDGMQVLYYVFCEER